MRYCGREFSDSEIDWLRQLLVDKPEMCRQHISIRLCQEFGWRKPDGGLKDMSCRVALLRMQRDGLIILPPPKAQHHKPRKTVDLTLFGEPAPEIHKKASEFQLDFQLVDKSNSALWNELVDRYHYLGYTPLPGAQLRYFVGSADGILALLGFGASAWKTAPRDMHIGWDAATRQKNLHLIVNNARFLILPWVHSKCLASRILSLAARRLASDWESRYAYRPVLLETFVENNRFSGTCYKAANWLYVGNTQGRGKLDVHNEYKLPVKSVWLYPLARDYRRQLCQG